MVNVFFSTCIIIIIIIIIIAIIIAIIIITIIIVIIIIICNFQLYHHQIHHLFEIFKKIKHVFFTTAESAC